MNEVYLAKGGMFQEQYCQYDRVIFPIKGSGNNLVLLYFFFAFFFDHKSLVASKGTGFIPFYILDVRLKNWK
jgi:hypothetical protein